MPRRTTSEVEAAIGSTIAAARAAEREGGWITYLARDPRRLDLKGNPVWPIYVGQSKEFGKRLRNHLRTSEKLAQAHDSVRKRFRQILHDGHVPIFEVRAARQPVRRPGGALNSARLARLGCAGRGGGGHRTSDGCGEAAPALFRRP